MSTPAQNLDPYESLLNTFEAQPPAPSFKDYRDVSTFAQGQGFHVTSTTGGTHNVGSAHYQGRAVDVRSRDKSDDEVKSLIDNARSQGLIVHDERQRPEGQAVWSGPHIHLEVAQHGRPKQQTQQDPYESLLGDIEKQAKAQPTPQPTDDYEKLLDSFDSPAAPTPPVQGEAVGTSPTILPSRGTTQSPATFEGVRKGVRGERVGAFAGVKSGVRGANTLSRRGVPQISNPDVNMDELPVYDAQTGQVLPSKREQATQTAQALGGAPIGAYAGRRAQIQSQVESDIDRRANVRGDDYSAALNMSPALREQKVQLEVNRAAAQESEQTARDQQTERMLTPDDRVEIERRAKAGATTSYLTRSVLNPFFNTMGVGGDEVAAGLARLAEDMSQSESLAKMFEGLDPHAISDHFRKSAYMVRKSVEKADELSPMSATQKALATGADLVGNVALMEAAAKLGGSRAAFGGVGFLSSKGRGESYPEAIGEGVKQEAIRNVFEHTANMPLVQRAATVYAATVAIEKASGATDEQAVKSAATNAGFVGVPEAAGRAAKFVANPRAAIQRGIESDLRSGQPTESVPFAPGRKVPPVEPAGGRPTNEEIPPVGAEVPSVVVSPETSAPPQHHELQPRRQRNVATGTPGQFKKETATQREARRAQVEGQSEVGKAYDKDWLEFSPEEREEIGREVERQEQTKRASVSPRQVPETTPREVSRVPSESEAGAKGGFSDLANTARNVRAAQEQFFRDRGVEGLKAAAELSDAEKSRLQGEWARVKGEYMARQETAPEQSGTPVKGEAGAGEKDATQPDWLRQNLDVLNTDAERKGIANKIEDLAAQRKTAKEIARQLGVDADTVRAVRSKRGIPGMDDKTAFEAWLSKRMSVGGTPVKGEEGAKFRTPEEIDAAIDKGVSQDKFDFHVIEPKGARIGGEIVESYRAVKQHGKWSVYRAKNSDNPFSLGLRGEVYEKTPTKTFASQEEFKQFVRETQLPTTRAEAKVEKSPTRPQVQERAKTEKVNPRTGLKPSQTDYLAGELVKAADKHIEENTGEESGRKLTGPEVRARFKGEGGIPRSIFGGEMREPVEIKVPDDGEYKVRSAQAANRLHQKVTGEPIEGFERAKGTSLHPARNTIRLSKAEQEANTDVEAVLQAYGGEKKAHDALVRLQNQLDRDPAAAEEIGGDRARLDGLVDEISGRLTNREEANKARARLSKLNADLEAAKTKARGRNTAEIKRLTSAIMDTQTQIRQVEHFIGRDKWAGQEGSLNISFLEPVAKRIKRILGIANGEKVESEPSFRLRGKREQSEPSIRGRERGAVQEPQEGRVSSATSEGSQRRTTETVGAPEMGTSPRGATDTARAKEPGPIPEPISVGEAKQPKEIERTNTPATRSRSFPKSAEEAGAIDIDLLTLGVRPFVKGDVVPKGRALAQGVAEAADGIKALLAPASRGPQAKETAGIVRANAAQKERQYDIAEESLKGAKSYFNSRPASEGFSFIDRMEAGQKQANPNLQNFADTMRDLLDGRRDAIRALGTGKLENFIENYFPHVWKDPKKAQTIFADLLAKRPLQGSRAFLKQRSIPTVREGMNLGLEPASNNPVDLTLSKLAEMDKYLMAHRIMGEMKDSKLLTFVRSTEKIPEGYEKINDSVATVFGGPASKPQGGTLIRGYYVAPEPAARVLNNYLSPGIRGTAFKGPFELWRASGNLLNQAQLGISFFHAGFTTVDVAVSRFSLGLEDALRYGRPARALKTIASTPLSPITNLIQGSKVLAEWRRPGTQGNDIAQMVDAMVEAGGRPSTDRFYRGKIAERMMNAFREGNIIGGALRLPGAAVETAAKPVMEWLVPRQKAGIFAEMARREIERLGPNASRAEVREALGKAWDSVDNRMGQLVYDNIFWNKAAKDLAMSSVRSVGWNLGTIREVGGGVRDVAAVPGKIVRKARGQQTDPLFTHRMAYMAALPVVVGTLGGMTTYLLTGERPKELKDYFFPRTGNVDESGNPERLALPSYMKDIYPVMDRAVRGDVGGTVTTLADEAKHKLHPLINLVAETLSNRDYYGTEIRNEDDPIMQQLIDTAKHVGEAATPFSVKGLMKERERGASVTKQILPFVGITPAPSYVNKSEAVRMMDELGEEKSPPGTRTREEAARSKLEGDFTKRMRRGENVRGELRTALQTGAINPKDVERIASRARQTPLQVKFGRLGLDDAMRVYDVMTTDEKREVKSILAHKSNLLDNVPVTKRRDTAVRLRQMLAQ